MSFNDQDFLNAITGLGIEPHGSLTLISDGLLHRYRVAGDKSGSLNGWYVIHLANDIYYGAYGSWKSGANGVWSSKEYSALSNDERMTFKRKQDEISKQIAEQRKDLVKKTADKAAYLWAKSAEAKAVNGAAGAQSIGVHPYIVRKKIKPYGVRLQNDNLLVPVRNSNGDLMALQFILPSGDKRFMTGGQKNGCYAPIGKLTDNGVLCICEGFATGASIREATGYAVAVAFDSGNLGPVTKVLRDKLPSATIIICADNDVATAGNPGLSKAQACVGQSGVLLAVPRVQDLFIDGQQATDFNDIHCLLGLDAVRTAINLALSPGPANPVDSPACELGAPGNQPAVSLPEFEAMIDEADDFDRLTVDLLQVLAQADFKKPAIEMLLGKIAKKSGSTKKVLADEFKTLIGGSHQRDQFNSDCQIIATLNQDHAVIPIGGQVRIMNKSYDPVLRRRMITFSTKSDFELRYCNKKIYDRGDEVGHGEYWINHPDRAEYNGIVFLPGCTDTGEYLNLWQGWGCDPVKGCVDKWRQFVSEVICSSDDELFDYVINWCAHMVQRPQELPEATLVLRGGQGWGKDRFVKPLAEIVGNEHFIALTSMKQVSGQFTGHLSNVLLVQCNEAVWGGDKNAEGTLKAMITDPVQPIEQKGKDITSVANFKRLIFSTNEGWAVPRGQDDRRYVILDVSNSRKTDHEYFAGIMAELESGGYEALFYFLLNRNINDWHPRMIPDRIKKMGYDLKLRSAGTIQKWWYDALNNGYLLEHQSYSDDSQAFWPDRCPTSDVITSYLKHCHQYKVTHPECSSVLGEELRKFGVGKCRPAAAPGQRRPEFYKLPTLDEARAKFSELFMLPDDHWACTE